MGLEYNGDNICNICHNITKSQQRIFVSHEATVAKKQIENFYNVAQMHLAI